MVGFRGAVEDGVRSIALLVGAVAAGLTGYLSGNAWLGLGVFAVVAIVGYVWAARAGAKFARKSADGDSAET